MGKFNQKPTTTRKIEKSNPITNLAGGVAFDPEPKLKLTLKAITALMGKDKYYQTAGDADSDLNNAIDAVLAQDPEYVLKLARFCRTEMHLRSLPIWLLARYAISGVKLPNTRHYVEDTVQRVDEIMELIAASFALTNVSNAMQNTLPNFVKYGLRGAFNKFDGYQFSKYNRPNEIKLLDALRLVHPLPKDCDQSKLFYQIKTDTLEPAQTWERYISMNGSTKENWEFIRPRMPHMAMLKNLRNFLLTGANIDAVVEQFTNPEAVLNGKQLPFNYLTAFRAIQQIKNQLKPTYNMQAYSENVGVVMDALQTALDISVANVPKLRGRSLILVDHSGSMTNHEINKLPETLGKRDNPDRVKIYASDIAGLFGAMSAHICDKSTVVVFATEHKSVPISKRDGILTTAEKLVSAKVAENTFAHLPIIHALKKGFVYDRIIIFSDMQCYSDVSYNSSMFFRAPQEMANAPYHSVAEAFMEYQKRVNQNAFLHSIDLCGYGTTLLPNNAKNVCALGGWSDKIFDFMHMYETNRQTLVERIEDYKMPVKKNKKPTASKEKSY